MRFDMIMTAAVREWRRTWHAWRRKVANRERECEDEEKRVDREKTHTVQARMNDRSSA
jgi:hypothetical protein